MSDAEIVVSLTIAIAGELELLGWAGVGWGVGAGVGVATGFAGGRGVVRRLCPDASEKKVTTTKNKTAGLDKFIFLIGARASSLATRVLSGSRQTVHDNKILRQNANKTDEPARVPSHLTRELSHRLERIDLIGILVGSQTHNAGKAQCESALVALWWLNPVKSYF